MNRHTIQGDRVPIYIWANLNELEEDILPQLKHVAGLPWVFSHVAVMPDVHRGVGATIGSVIATKGAVAPAAVGVDIGCGMIATRTSLTAEQLPDSLRDLRTAIERTIPVGFNEHRGPLIWHAADSLFSAFPSLTPEVQGLKGKARCQLGTLGSGNHFIEVCLDETQRVWVMLHSGSRHIGKALADAHIHIARRQAHNKNLPDQALSVLLEGTPTFAAFQHDLHWAQAYARENRALMLHLLRGVLASFFPRIVFEETISCHHNYVSEETHFGENVFVTRKGAIRARQGEMGIIPGSMGTKSYIVCGLGSKESFESASHGAGRRMSRAKAKKQFTPKDAQIQTQHVECRKDPGILDELPGAYKDIDWVMEQQRDLVEVIHTLKQVLCVKG